MASNKIRSRIIYRYDIVVSTVEEYIQKINGQSNIIQRNKSHQQQFSVSYQENVITIG